MGDFNFNAPQYVDFTSSEALELNDYGEEYFDMDHEIEIQYNEEQCHELKEEQEFHYANETTPEPCDPLEEYEVVEVEKPKLRRSVSAGQILLGNPKTQDLTCDLSPALEALQLSEKRNNNKLHNGLDQNTLPSKTIISSSNSDCGSTTKLNKPLKQRPKAISRDAIHKIGQHKNDQLKRKMSVENLHPNKYISIAEAINKYQFGTPQRFHTKSSKIQFNSHKTTALAQTIPQSPMLSTKQRNRQPTCVSRQDQEQMEAEEMKKYQIKANAVNYKILRAPVLNAKVEKKASTVPQPFKFTEVQFHKPVELIKTEVYEFHARPAPKTTATKPNVRRSVMPTTTAVTPSFMRRMRETLPKFQEDSKTQNEVIRSVELQHDGLTKKVTKAKTPVRTKLEPFSFENRDKLMQQRKEEKIKKFLEEEKKAREFHARPIPSKIAGGCGQVESKVGKIIHHGSNSSLGKNDENVEPNKVLFKAKPASVIHKKPFIPKKEDRPLLEISEFSLNTDKRAKEREEFEKKMKDKEEEYEKMKIEQAERQKQSELEEINRIRKETVHKANPIKHYKPIEIHPSTRKVTSPISPMITKKRTSRYEN